MYRPQRSIVILDIVFKKMTYDPNNPLITVMKLLISDPHLRRKFIANPAAVFKQIGLGKPVDMVGYEGNFCPVMPKLLNTEADFDISHKYWSEWLQGGVNQLQDFRRLLEAENRFPARSSFKSESEWNDFYQTILSTIKQQLRDCQEADRIKHEQRLNDKDK